jgi:predicted transcriptional regulator of viral defense system
MGLKTNKYRSGLSKKGSFLLSFLSRENKIIFNINEVEKIIKENPKRLMSYLIQKKWVLQLKRGLYAIVPLEIGVRGSDDFLVHDFVVAPYLAKPYYIGFWSALNYHGLSDQIPKSVFIAITKAKKPIMILNSEFVFIQIKKDKFFGIDDIWIDENKIKISNINKTVVDCLDHPEHSGGIEEIACAIYFNHKGLNFKKIREYALRINNITIFKRLGYILDKIKLLDEYKYIFKDIKLTKGYSKLVTIPNRKGKYNERWKLIINVVIDPERWMY